MEVTTRVVSPPGCRGTSIRCQSAIGHRVLVEAFVGEWTCSLAEVEVLAIFRRESRLVTVNENALLLPTFDEVG